jgi:hypothetical protein
MFAPSGILSDERIENLSSVGPIGRLNELERVVGMDWPWFGRYGDNLLEELKKLNIPLMQPKPQQTRAEKRTIHELEDGSSQKEPAQKKRAPKHVAPTQNPTPTTVTANPALSSHWHPATPTAIATPHPYATPQYYATPHHLPHNPYSFMRYPLPYPMPGHPQSTPTFYSYLQTPMQPSRTIPSSSNVGARNVDPPSSSSAGGQNGGDT